MSPERAPVIKLIDSFFEKKRTISRQFPSEKCRHPEARDIDILARLIPHFQKRYEFKVQDIELLFRTNDPTGPAMGMFSDRLEVEIQCLDEEAEKLEEKK